MLENLISLSCSYLKIEEILSLHYPNYIAANIIIKKYKIKIPDPYFCCVDGNLEVVKYFLYRGIKLGEYAINLAAQNGNLNIVKYLCEYGINYSSFTIDITSKYGYLDVIKYLVENDGYMKISDNAINLALERGYLEVAEYLRSKKENKFMRYIRHLSSYLNY